MPRFPFPARALSALPALLMLVLVPILPQAALAADSVRTLPPFIAIDCKGPLSITVEVGQAQSLRVIGEDRFVAAVRTEVRERELSISLPDKGYNNMKGDPRIVITVPSLSRVKVEGAGETLLNKINGDRIDISYLGAGHLVANGKVKYLRLSAKGVGEIDTKGLVADRVDVNFEGVGAVSVYARELLNAVASGMGSLEYFGHPRTVNKSAHGIGSVSAGD